ncbi:hypothetical protein WJ968_24530 [Achromobacter xylosoxidans]
MVPSGCARATTSVPTEAPAPGLFSTMTVMFDSLRSTSPRRRPIASALPPAV